MKFYIDTVTVRRFAKFFNNSFFIDNCFVSIHVICELLTDLNEENFFIKRNAINKIFENNIFIDWEQPHKKHFESFGFLNVKYNLLKDNVSLFCEIINKSNDFLDFNKNIISYKEKYEIITNYDKAFDSYFKKEINLKINDYSSVYSHKEGTDICDKIIEELKTTELGFYHFYIAMCIKMAEDLYHSPVNMYLKRTVEDIVNSYNGNIDYFLIVSGIYSITKVSRKEQISRNDFNDLYHLMYLKNNYIIITDDVLFNKYMGETFPDNIISCNEFYDRYINTIEN